MKGQVLDTGVNFVMAIVFIAILGGVGLITLAAFSSSTTDTNAKAGIANGTSSLSNLMVQMPTVGTIMGVGIILLVVFVAFGYFMNKR